MVASLIGTKISIPPSRINLVRRPRLIRRLNSGVERKLTVVTAPAGSGKTTLLSDWAGQQDIPIAWLSLDVKENDTDRFLTYFISALQSIEPSLKLMESITTLRQAPQSTPQDVILTLMVNELTKIQESLAIVLDDYHLISNPEIHDILLFLLEHLPQNVHFIIASRADPNLPLAKLRARDQLLEITELDLRFTYDEVATFIRDVMGLALSAIDIETLEARTEGWIAGLQLAALSIEGRQDPTAFITSLRGTHRYILDYLAEEVFNELPRVLQIFLLWISPLTRFNTDLCDEVVGDLFQQDWDLGFSPWDAISKIDSKVILEFLDDSHLFVFPLDHERQWYRFHPLFSDFLQDRLNDRYLDEVPELHRRAAKWFSENGFIAEAIDNALSAGDIHRAAELITGQVKPLLAQGETSMLIRWIEALPSEVLLSRPELDLGLAFSRMLSDPIAFERISHEHVDRLKGSLGGEEKVLKELRENDAGSEELITNSEYILLTAFLARNEGDHDRTIDLFKAAVTFLGEDDYFTRAFALSGLASTYARAGMLDLAESAFARAAENGLQSGSAYAFIAPKDWEATVQAVQGYLNQAIATYRMAIDHISDKGIEGLPLTGHAFVGLAEIFLEKNELDMALDHVEEGIRRGVQVNDIDALREGYLIKSRILVAMGDESGYREAMRKGLDIARIIPSLLCLEEGQAWEAIHQIARGEIASAAGWASNRGLTTPIDLDTVETTQEIERRAFARLLVAQRKIPEAEAVLESLLSWTEENGLVRSTIEILVLLSLVLHAAGKREQALRTLARALMMAEPEGYIRTFINEGPIMATLLRSAAAQGHSPEYVNRLLNAFGEELSPATPLEPLTERELDVLRLIASGLTNAEIAEELVIAQSTVKTHINRIYSKLGVTQRTQAVVRARELRLIQ